MSRHCHVVCWHLTVNLSPSARLERNRSPTHRPCCKKQCYFLQTIRLARHPAIHYACKCLGGGFQVGKIRMIQWKIHRIHNIAAQIELSHLLRGLCVSLREAQQLNLLDLSTKSEILAVKESLLNFSDFSFTTLTMGWIFAMFYLQSCRARRADLNTKWPFEFYVFLCIAIKTEFYYLFS